VALIVDIKQMVQVTLQTLLNIKKVWPFLNITPNIYQYQQSNCYALVLTSAAW
jgi:hypothetical protein